MNTLADKSKEVLKTIYNFGDRKITASDVASKMAVTLVSINYNLSQLEKYTDTDGNKIPLIRYRSGILKLPNEKKEVTFIEITEDGKSFIENDTTENE